MTDYMKKWLSNDIATDKENGITVFKCYDLDKWMMQNNALISDELDGVLQDNYFFECRNGVAVALEYALNCWSSVHVVKFARYGTPAEKEIYRIWQDFMTEYDKAVNE